MANVPPIEGGTALMDGHAVIEIANSYYGRHGGEGAIYQLCYSIGMEDWCLPATREGQADPNDVEGVEVGGSYYSFPEGPADNMGDVRDEYVSQGGQFPVVVPFNSVI